FLVWAIGTRALAGIVNPANEVIVICFFADAGQVGGEGPADHLIAFSDGMAGETAAALEQFLAVRGVAEFVPGKRIGEGGLPDIGRNCLDLVIVVAEVSHLSGGTKIGGVLR